MFFWRKKIKLILYAKNHRCLCNVYIRRRRMSSFDTFLWIAGGRLQIKNNEAPAWVSSDLWIINDVTRFQLDFFTPVTLFITFHLFVTLLFGSFDQICLWPKTLIFFAEKLTKVRKHKKFAFVDFQRSRFRLKNFKANSISFNTIWMKARKIYKFHCPWLMVKSKCYLPVEIKKSFGYPVILY